MPEPSELAELLEALKRRSGRSYTALAHRTGLSRSTLHRYCQGLTVPGSFGAVERVARVCGASPAELDRLYRVWSRTTAEEAPDDRKERPDGDGERPDEDRERPDEDGAGTGGSGSGSGDGAGASGDGSGESLWEARLPLRRLISSLRVVALLVVLVVASAASAYLPGDSGNGAGGTAPALGAGRGSPASAGQRFDGPLWSVAPRRVQPEFFGLTMNTDTGEMPAFRTGAVRLWESGTRWGAIEPRRGRYSWSVLERSVDSAERHRLPVLLTLSGTPLWAAPGGRRSGYADSLASPPADLADWDRFVEEVVTRYRGRIESYELWDYPSHPLHYAGSIAVLAKMVERAATIIRRVDPGALVACPSFGELWKERGRELLRQFARTGAYESCDAAALKLPPSRADSPPEEIIDLARQVHDTMFEEGLGEIEVWNTGPDRSVAVTPPLDARRARDYAVRFYLAGLYSRHYGVQRMYFYSWGSTGVPLVVQPVGGRPTQAGLRMGRLWQWLDGARIAACGQGAQLGLPEGAYTCRFERDGRPFLVRWTTKGRADVPVDEGAYRLRRMDGRTVPLRTGGRIGFGEEPVMVEYRTG
ncbi:helix-turn-helix domain-containing protein [Streptomyces sp. NBC_01591]|uniref:helix-turn-helix domain-containing protein n=1 Tax=Streptomyces sp. NBC_01591 TaxID=2975888 RepID=UPI002DDA6561|nr:helix-turn-helix domain-containing protein [Streptomyces sp. NBC_01591]WSD69760.1 helix-turn-helix domain-containing protein [Streptomyces sp. NBC_01591]